MRKCSLSAAVFITVAAFAMPAKANIIDISGTFSGTGSGGTPPVFTESFSGDGVDTTFGSFIADEQATVDVTNPSNFVLTDGTFDFIFHQGTLSGTFSGSGAPGSVAITLLITSGFLAGDTGSGTGTGSFSDTGSVDGSYQVAINTVGTLVSDPSIPGPNPPYYDLVAPAPPSTPLPAALPLCATGLGALGLLSWRRKRKTQAVAL